jgi:hypothetical protein
MSDLRFLQELAGEFDRVRDARASRRLLPLRRAGAGVLVGLSAVVVVAVAALVLSARRTPLHPGMGRGDALSGAHRLAGSASEPLSGTVPGKVTASRGARGLSSVSGDRYNITVSPSLGFATGPGWTIAISYDGPGFGRHRSGGVTGADGYPTRTNPVFGGTGDSFFASGDRQRGDDVGFVITGPQVAAVRFGGRTIRTFASSQLPAGDRAAVFFQDPGSPQPVVGWRPGAQINALNVPTSKRVRSVWLLPLDNAGHPIPTIPPTYPTVTVGSYWQAPSAVTSSIHHAPYNGPTRPGAGACELTARGLAGLTPEWGHTFANITLASHVVGELFLSCVDTEYYLHGWPLDAAVLLDGRQPGHVLGPIPGTQPVLGDQSLVDSESEKLSARRVGNAWLVVQGGSGMTQRLRVLQALQISKLNTGSG